MNIDLIKLRRRRSFLSCLRVQSRVVGALMLRETMTRYGHENLGFFWLMGEPLLLTLGVMVLWTLMNGTHGTGVEVVPFILTGYSLLVVWRNVIFRSVHCLRHNAGLLFHLNIRGFDTLFARSLLEMIGAFAAFFIAYVPLLLFGLLDPIHDPLILVVAWILLAWLAFGVALNIAALTELFAPVEYFVHPTMYLLIPASGAFFMVSWLPDKVRDAVLWSPMVHASEMFRAGFFSPDTSTTWNAWYLVAWCAAFTASGLPLVRIAQNRVQGS